VPDHVDVEVAFDPGSCAGRCAERFGIDHFLSRAPYLREVSNGGWLIRNGDSSLPADQRLVEPAPVPVRPDRPFEIVDEGVHFFVRRSQIKVAVPVRHVAPDAIAEYISFAIANLAGSRSGRSAAFAYFASR
jgi:hypothetical protein